jgi:hypothetical protein
MISVDHSIMIGVIRICVLVLSGSPSVEKQSEICTYAIQGAGLGCVERHKGRTARRRSMVQYTPRVVAPSFLAQHVPPSKQRKLF